MKLNNEEGNGSEFKYGYTKITRNKSMRINKIHKIQFCLINANFHLRLGQAKLFCQSQGELAIPIKISVTWVEHG